ncbi:hypothetical protein CKM354_000873200 [Cercospora kikuchii]|uniref:Uncharacterized protein n=1 Tax=Cercospora kikuchii TaxID=84275 RepID=A0A9P3FIP3_9PEZI|nr:uncharacterized protein CKM354_000873200 [Cercospora kikuchii]GIZ45572.1 hypothetical protein CKM354_000873200 [Cercospora kikuchii]
MKPTELMTMTDFFLLQQDITFDSHGNLQAQVDDAVYNSTSFYIQDHEEEEDSIDSDSDQDTVSDEQTTAARVDTTPRRPLCLFIIKGKKLCKGICHRLSRSAPSASQQGQTSTPLLPTTSSYIDWDLAVLEHNLSGIGDLGDLIAWLYRNLDIREQINGLWWPVMQECKGEEGAELLLKRLGSGSWWIAGDESGELKDTVVDVLGRRLENRIW